MLLVKKMPDNAGEVCKMKTDMFGACDPKKDDMTKCRVKGPEDCVEKSALNCPKGWLPVGHESVMSSSTNGLHPFQCPVNDAKQKMYYKLCYEAKSNTDCQEQQSTQLDNLDKVLYSAAESITKYMGDRKISNSNFAICEE